MILIITLNPLLEYRYTVPEITLGATYRDVPVKLKAGGKGINISRQLKHLNTNSLNLTFLGNFQGKKYKEVIDAEGLECVVVKTSDDTRIASIIVDSQRRKVTSFFSENSDIHALEAAQMIQRLDKMIQNCEIVIFSGSSPSIAVAPVFKYGIELARKYDKISVLDTYGAHLRECLDEGPTVIHNNLSEVTGSLGIELKTEKDMTDFLLSLYAKGTKQAFITNGEKEFYASNHDFIYKVDFPKVDAFDPTGSGDAFTAGIVYGLHYDRVFEDTLKFACALGAVNAQYESVCDVKPDSVEEYKTQVKVQPVGKKMKLVDVTPTA